MMCKILSKSFFVTLFLLNSTGLMAMPKTNGLDKSMIELESEIRNESQTRPMLSGSRLNLKNINGRIEIEGWDKNEIQVDAVITDNPEYRIKIETTQDNQGITINVQFPKQFYGSAFFGLFQWNLRPWKKDSLKCDLKLRVPRKLQGSFTNVNGFTGVNNIEGSIAIDSVNGDFEVRSIKGVFKGDTTNGTISVTEADAELELKTVNGSIKLDQVSGSIKAGTVNGSILAKNLNGKDGGMSFKTVNGGVRLALGSASGTLHLTNLVGKITYTDNTGRLYRGNRLFSTDIPGSQQKIKVATVNGSIEVVQ